MANPLKILTVLTASQAAKFEQGIDVNSQKVTGLANGVSSTDAAAYGQVTALSESVKSYVDAADGVLDARITSVSGAISGAFDARLDFNEAAFTTFSTVTVPAISSSISGTILARDTAQTLARNALSQSVSSSLDAEAAARAAEDLTFLKLNGSRAMTGHLNGLSASFNGDMGVSGSLTVQGGLQVNGQLTYVNTTNLDVTDKLVTLAKGAANAAAADGGGIEIEGAGASLTYVDASTAWKFNKDLQVSGNLKVDGRYVRLGSNNSAVLEDREDVYGASELVEIAPSYNTASIASSDVVLASANLSDNYGLWLGSSGSFLYIDTPIETKAGRSTFNVGKAIYALDVAVSGAANTSNTAVDNLKTAYGALREKVTGSLGGATETETLSFVAADLEWVVVDVSVSTDGGSSWTNDLVAVKLYADGGFVKVDIDAPGAAAGAKYRIVAVNEKETGLN